MIETKPRACILTAVGTNCDAEMKQAFDLAGGKAEIVRLVDLIDKKASLKDFQLLGLPGGFSYGDAIRSGIVQANMINRYLADEVNDFMARRGLVIGVCNGFQVLVGTGLLPGGRVGGDITAGLTFNQSGHFECNWRTMRVEPSRKSLFTEGLPDQVSFQVAHGEGRFIPTAEALAQIETGGQVVLRYSDLNNQPTMEYPDNPNGATNAIAGIVDPSGQALGLMPHPERFVRLLQHPNARRPDGYKTAHGRIIFENMVKNAA